MADENPSPKPEIIPPGGTAVRDGLRKMAFAVYIIYVAGAVLSFGLLTLVGLILAYVNRGEARGTWVESHFTWQIRTFWIGLLYSIIGAILGALTAWIGGWVLVGLALLVWGIVRLVKGWSHLVKEQAVPDVETWLW